MKPTTVADEMFPEGPPYTDVEDVGETTVFQQVHSESEDFYKGKDLFMDVSGSWLPGLIALFCITGFDDLFDEDDLN